MPNTIRIELFHDNEKHVLTNSDNEFFTLIETDADRRYTLLLRPKKGFTLVSCEMTLDKSLDKDDLLFLNGYQSWTDTREFKSNESIPTVKFLPGLKDKFFHTTRYGDSYFLKNRKNVLHGFTYSYIEHKDGNCDFIGSLNEENAYLIIQYRKNEKKFVLKSDVEGKLVAEDFPLYDYLRLSGKKEEVSEEYFSEYGTCHAPKVKGYTSWYNDYQNISEEKMLTVLDGIDSNTYDVFQIDDGYETFVGDWMDVDTNKFPNGLKPIVDKIHDKGMKAGIWLAPFVVETKSKVYQEHKDWIYSEDGKEVFAGCNWSGDVALDLSKKEVRDYIRKCLQFYIDLGFDFFKLDFLYAASMNSKEEKRTRAESMREAMRFLRDILKDKQILGCGVPLSSAFSLVDYCRIGPDVSLVFDDVFYMHDMHRERISTKVTLQNTIFRKAMDGHVFRNDPDVYLLRDDNISLNEKQKESLVLLNHLFGSVYFTSDNVTHYDEKKKALLKRAQSLVDAEIKEVRTMDKTVKITYLSNGKENTLTYDTVKGTIL